MKQKLKRFMAGFMAMLTLVGTLFTNGTTAFAASPQANIAFWNASVKNSGEVSELKPGYNHGKILYSILDGNSAYCMNFGLRADGGQLMNSYDDASTSMSAQQRKLLSYCLYYGFTICGDDMTKDEWYKQLFERLDNSKFRSSFHLKQKDIDYINEKGLDTIRQHAKDFIAKREAPAYIANDGKQTPMRGHPVFIAQHATATCCRECIRKWHKMQPGKELSQVQQDYLVDVIMTWIQKEMERQEHKI